MDGCLQIGDRIIPATEILSLLNHYQLLPQLVRELVIDQAIADITCTFEEIVAACKAFYAKEGITTDAEVKTWLAAKQITAEQLESLTTRSLRIEKFKHQMWGNKLESYFLKRKGTLDRVIYSLIRTSDIGTAQELYFRINEGEQPFADLARDYSQGPEAQTGGIIGPVELSVPHAALAHILTISQPGQLWPPNRIGDWWVITRLEKFLPAQLDDPMRQRLLNELFSQWLDEQVNVQVKIQ